eukprot:TRINITY_DN15241_c0_g1_i1.p1 TRINITY_DN15241_c0_g1~~TRINITY_DN15241_c0_g1_i1.p1  ORF type:complete len:467 (-),score=99.46 TRINITY_DN15241_c0_g1_i1:187-1539(-)
MAAATAISGVAVVPKLALSAVAIAARTADDCAAEACADVGRSAREMERESAPDLRGARSAADDGGGSCADVGRCARETAAEVRVARVLEELLSGLDDTILAPAGRGPEDTGAEARARWLTDAETAVAELTALSRGTGRFGTATAIGLETARRRERVGCHPQLFRPVRATHVPASPRLTGDIASGRRRPAGSAAAGNGSGSGGAVGRACGGASPSTPATSSASSSAGVSRARKPNGDASKLGPAAAVTPVPKRTGAGVDCGDMATRARAEITSVLREAGATLDPAIAAAIRERLAVLLKDIEVARTRLRELQQRSGRQWRETEEQRRLSERVTDLERQNAMFEVRRRQDGSRLHSTECLLDDAAQEHRERCLMGLEDAAGEACRTNDVKVELERNVQMEIDLREAQGRLAMLKDRGARLQSVREQSRILARENVILFEEIQSLRKGNPRWR